MSSGAALEQVDAAMAEIPVVDKGMVNSEKSGVFQGDLKESAEVSDSEVGDVLHGPNGEIYPTKEEIQTLRRVCGRIPLLIYTIGFVELCERFAYYGTTAVFVNFIQQPLPPGSTTGAGGTNEQAGALDMGQRAATGLTLFNSFWSYIMPLLGGYLADTYWGRFKTINYAIVVATVGHVLLIVAALPPVIENNRGALGAFIIGLILFGVGVGWFKCNISPLIAEQYEHDHPRQIVKVLPTGERVIVDPIMTISRIYMRYYLMINVGALVGQISMVYAEKYVGFWLSFLLPTIMFLFCPVVMFLCRKRYVRRPPTYSVLSRAWHLVSLAMKTTPMRDWNKGGFWERVKPSNIEGPRPEWMQFDDAWVDEVRRGFKACAVFMFLPIYWLSYSQMLNNLVSQAATMTLNGVPNDVVNNLDPFALIIFIPIFDKFIYPALARAGFNFTPLKKIFMGFVCGTLAMVVAALIQHYIYQKSPCGKQASSCEEDPGLSVWIQTPAYLLIAFSEIFASITGLEYAFTKAPKNMRSLVTSVFWFSHAFSSAIAQAMVSLSADPLLVWLYTTVAIISTVGMIGFWYCFRGLDKEEDRLNALPESTYIGRKTSAVDIEAVRAEQEKQDKIRKAQGLQ